MSSVETSVIIPTLDDALTITQTLENLNSAMAAAGAPAEVLIVDAGSRDGTLELAAELAERFPLLHTRLLVQDRSQSGFGTALRLGIAYAEGQYCVVLMPDARDPLELIPKMLGELRNGAHLVLCSRFDEGEGKGNLPLRFVIYQKIYQRGIRFLLGVEIPDSTYGFRAFNRTFVLALGIAGRRMSVMSEITFKVLLAGGKTVRLPGVQSGPMIQEQPKFRLGHELAGYLSTLIRASLHRLGIRWF
ncbi:MAG TPA: glycosyltransferase family 2 protein [Acidimicrobiales bacterium]|nr:glycosyltransferase family 2 protein [Acidimicrobiales bacterium]